MVNIASQVAKNELSRESAIAILQKSFNMSEQEAESIIGNEKLEQPSIDDKIETMETKDSWKEEEHPRDENGKFSESGESKNEPVQIHTEFGQAFREYSYKPKEAIDFLLKQKSGYVPAAINKNGIGDIDFVYGKGGKNGYGLAHIIERRNSENNNGIEFVKQLPELIEKGQVITKIKHTDRKYILSKNKEITVRLDYNGEKRNWIVTAYTKKELSNDNSF